MLACRVMCFVSSSFFSDDILQWPIIVINLCKDVGMAKHFSKKYGNKRTAFNYLQSESYVKMHVSA